jgi:Family of unknown function (DUF6447)
LELGKPTALKDQERKSRRFDFNLAIGFIKMSTVRIDDIDYELDLLTEEVKAQLTSLQQTDQKIGELQRDLAIAQTARISYANALRELLGHGAEAPIKPPVVSYSRH